MTAILGISAFFHDAAAALVVDGQVIAAAPEERFSRKKHDADFPAQAIDFCLEQAGLEIEDLDHVVFYEKPFLKFERILETNLAFAPRGLNSFTISMPIWLKSKLHLTRVIAKGLDRRYRKRIIFPEHHQSHAASAFFPSPFEQAAILTVDGAGEWATTTLGIGTGNQVELLKELTFPDSLGLLYSAFTYFCGFRVNGGEGKLMGLAPYGDPVYVETILENLIALREDGSFRLNQDFFDYCTGEKMTSPAFDKLFGGPPRTPDSQITQREKNLAASIQSVTETVLIKMAWHLQLETGMKHLCIAGGVALNCVANGRLLREGPFEDVWVQPAAGDSGGAIGAALFVWHQLLGNDRNPINFATQFLGPEQNRESVKSCLDGLGAVYHEFQEEDQLIDSVCRDLESQQVVGWFQGRMEFCPRALGNRSILADPRRKEMQRTLNDKIKFREPFRPFAPVILADRCREFFDLERSSPFMLFAANERDDDETRPTTATRVPAVIHVDGSSRIQTVTESENPGLYRLLKRFDQNTACPMLVNTSFNVRGEPMVCTAEDAYLCFMKSGMDALVIENFVMKKSDQPAFDGESKISKLPVSLWQRLLLVWLIVTYPIRWLLSKFVLSLVFLFFVTPIGYAARIRNRLSIAKNCEQSGSFWKTRSTVANPPDYFKQY